jgi:flagella basal body P-ring formation protein FlgA
MTHASHLPQSDKELPRISLLDAGLTRRERFWGLLALSLYWLALLALPVLMFASPLRAAEEGAFRVTLADAEKAVAETLKQEGLGENVRVSLHSVGIRNPLATYNSDIKVYVQHLQLDQARSKLETTLVFEADGVQQQPLQIAGRYDILQSIPVLNRAVRNGDVITENDVTMRDELSTRIRPDSVLNVDQLVGKTAQRTISPHRMVRTNELASPAVVQQGQQVTLRFVAHNLEIKSLGEVLDNGGVGDRVRVRNQDSKQIVQGTVEDTHTITIYGAGAKPQAPAAINTAIISPTRAPALVKTAPAAHVAPRQAHLVPELPEVIPNQEFSAQPAAAQHTALIDPMDVLEKHYDAN